MTFEDVKKIRENPTAEDVDNKELHKMIDVAVEKQIPKKPKLAYYESEFVNYHCAYCGEAQGKQVNKRWQKYCPHCGQALDWSDTE